MKKIIFSAFLGVLILFGSCSSDNEFDELENQRQLWESHKIRKL